MSDFYIGLMSGTSADGIDATLIEINEHQVTIKAHLDTPYDTLLRDRILGLCSPADNEIDRMGALDQQLGKAFAQAVKQLLEQAEMNPQDISGIGSHGQTIRHRPLGASPFTLQIADPNQIAHITGITTIADFRRRDMAARGQGAPLSPAFHRAAFSQPQQQRLIINIGGMANISELAGEALVSGFDTGPGNALMDAWIERHQGLKYDSNGDWASRGQVIPELLSLLLKHPYLSKPTPKSTGREDFHLDWLDQQLELITGTTTPVDVQATLLEFTCQSISLHIAQLREAPDDIYICGGGAMNLALMHRLSTLCPCAVQSTEQLGIDPQQVEGAAFAWLAHQTLSRATGNSPSVTGATQEVVLGGVYYA